MKVLIILALVAAAAAMVDPNAPIDFSKVVPVYELPEFRERYPQFNRVAGGSGRIVGGTEASPGQYPYIVGVFIHTAAGTGFCGATIISEEYILTAAHCIDMANVVGFTLVLGAHEINNSGESSQVRISPIDYVVHAGWDASVLQNDIALFRVEPITFNDRIQPIRLPSRSQVGNNWAGTRGVAVGWGRFSDSINEIAPRLRHVDNPIMANFNCNLRFLGVIQASHICLSGDGGRSTCSGDSGGPLSIVMADGVTIQVGTTSFGLAAGCERGWPGVFSRTTSFLNWIADNSNIEIRP